MQFEQWVIDRVVKRQGKLHPYDEIDGKKTAFVVVDMQNYFCKPGFQAACDSAALTFESINRMADATRKAGGIVIWIQTSSEQAATLWSHHHDNMYAPDKAARRDRELDPSNEGYLISEGLDVQPGDLRVGKTTYSALTPHGGKPSELQNVLIQRGIETVLVGGTATNVCCESTARDAMMLNYKTIMVDDTLSAMRDDEHQYSLRNFILFFGDVMNVDEVVERLK